MATWTLLDIRHKIRQVTGRLSANEMTDAELDDRINKFYQYTFPAETKLDQNHTYYELITPEHRHEDLIVRSRGEAVLCGQDYCF